MRIRVAVVTLTIISFLLSGCLTTPAGGCPYCGYPPGVLIDGEVTHCARCSGSYRTYLFGSVNPLTPPTKQFGNPVPTDNTQQNYNEVLRVAPLFKK